MKLTDDFFQVAPTSLPASALTADLEQLRNSLHSCDPQWPKGYDLSANPYPFYTPPERLAELQQVQTALHTALISIVRNWWATPRYQTAIPVTPTVERVLRKLDTRRPYTHIGSYRPDFLIPQRPQDPLSICEINARFAFNGFCAGDYIQNYLAKRETAGKMKGFRKSSAESILASYSELFDESKPLGLLKGRETGYDIHLFHQHSRHSRFIHPDHLKLVLCSQSPSGYTVADAIGPIEQLALELHQDELEALDEQVLLEVGARCYNDLRTVFFVHDKRMLGLIRQELGHLVATKVLTAEQAHSLRRGIVETHLPDTEAFRGILDDSKNRHMWLLKPCLSGKGDGIIFGKDLDEDTWKDIFKPNTSSIISSAVPYVVQRHFIQGRYKLFVQPKTSTESPRQVNWFVVGTILCLNKNFLGLTMWRTSPTDITAVSRGGEYMGGITDGVEPMEPAPLQAPEAPGPTPPTLEISDDARLHVSSLESLPDHVDSVKSALHKYGIAVVHINFDDPSSAYMLNLAKSIGTLIDHSKGSDPLWDVKPKKGSDLARSQTGNSFPWHTDCSFDTAPPRYFALHVIHADRCGGGKLKVLQVDKVLERLSAAALETLKRPVFRLKVPNEFHKDVNYVVGVLVTACGKIRYRREIIEPLGEEAEKALDELESLLQNSGTNGCARVLGPDIMTDGAVLCLDNAKWMHARSEVRDPDRWLRRVRWEPEEF